jgi:transposase
MSQVTVITGVERRRRFHPERKRELLEEAFRPGGSVAEVCRREEICSSLLYRWRREASEGRPIQFQQAALGDAGSVRRASGEAAVLVVELASGARVEARASAPPALLAVALKALT